MKPSAALALVLIVASVPAFAGELRSLVSGKTLKCGAKTLAFANNGLKVKIGQKFVDVGYGNKEIDATIGDAYMTLENGVIGLDDDDCKVVR